MDLNRVEPAPTVPPATTDSQADLPTPQRLAFARLLRGSTGLGLATLALTFLVYAMQILPSDIPPEELPAHWGKPLEQFHRDTGLQDRFGSVPGLRWVLHLDQSDYLVQLPIAFLAVITLFCYVMLAKHYLRQRSLLLLTVALLQLLVLLLAASGIAGGS
jgi:hypothetical protein